MCHQHSCPPRISGDRPLSARGSRARRSRDGWRVAGPTRLHTATASTAAPKAATPTTLSSPEPTSPSAPSTWLYQGTERGAHRHLRGERTGCQGPMSHNIIDTRLCATRLGVTSVLIPSSRRDVSGHASPTVDQAEPGRPVGRSRSRDEVVPGSLQPRRRSDETGCGPPKVAGRSVGDTKEPLPTLRPVTSRHNEKLSDHELRPDQVKLDPLQLQQRDGPAGLGLVVGDSRRGRSDFGERLVTFRGRQFAGDHVE